MAISSNGISIEATPSGLLIPKWLEASLLKDGTRDLVIIYPTEESREYNLTRLAKQKPSIDSSSHLTVERLIRSLLTDYRQPNVLEDDSLLLYQTHQECVSRAKKGRFPFLHKMTNKWSLSKTKRLHSLHQEVSKLSKLPQWETDPGVKEFRMILKHIEKTHSGIHPDLMKHNLLQILTETGANNLPFSLTGCTGIIILDHPPEFQEIERDIFISLSEMIPIHQLCNPGKFRLGYGGAYLQDINWCTSDNLPKWVPKHEVESPNHNAKWRSIIPNQKSNYHHILVERAEHIVDATFSLLDEIPINPDLEILIIDGAIKERHNNWQEKLINRGYYQKPIQQTLQNVSIIQELVFHLSLGSGLEAWSFERIRRLANSNNLHITFQEDNFHHPSDQEIIPRPHIDILEKISRSFHVLGGPGAAERWLATLANGVKQIGDYNNESLIKQEETQWWLANVIQLWSVLTDNEALIDEITGCYTGKSLPIINELDSEIELLKTLVKAVNWDILMDDDREFNRNIGAIETLLSKYYELDLPSSSNGKEHNSFIEIINLIVEKESIQSSRIDCSNIRVCAPSEAFGLSSDIIILAGLDANSWPMKSASVPWLDVSTKVKLGLNNSDIKIRQSRHQLRHLLNCAQSIVVIDTSLDESSNPSPPLAEWLDDVELDDKIFDKTPNFVSAKSYQQKNLERPWDLITKDNKKTLKLRVFSIESKNGKQFGVKSGTQGRDIRQRSGLLLQAGLNPESLPNSKFALAMSSEHPINNQKLNSQPSIKSIEIGKSLHWQARDSMISYEKINLNPSKSSADKDTRNVEQWPHLGVRVNGSITSPAIDPRPLPLSASLNPSLRMVMGQSSNTINPKTWSPYRLQSWLKCPRQAWLNDFLKLNPIELQDEDIDNRTRGLLMHDLEASILSKNGIPVFSTPLRLSKPLQLLPVSDIETLWQLSLNHLKLESPWLGRKNAVSVHRCREIIGVNPEIWTQYLEGMTEIEPAGKIFNFLKASIELKDTAPIVCEWGISTARGKPVVISGISDEGIKSNFSLSGRIDRVDHLYLPDSKQDGRLVIIRDMKTVVGPKAKDVGSRHRRAIFDELQLALYAKAWETVYPKDRVIGVGVTEVGENTEYFVEIDPDYVELVQGLQIGTVTTYTSNTYRQLDEPEPYQSNGFRSWLEERIRTAIRTVNSANSGLFNPTVSKHCKYCKVRRLCPTSILGGEN